MLSIFTLTFLYLPLFTYIWPNLALITLKWSYLPINFRAIGQLVMDILHFKELGGGGGVLSRNQCSLAVYFQFGSLAVIDIFFVCTFWCFTPVSNFKAIGQLVMEDLGETESVVTNAVVLVLWDLQVISPSVQAITTHGTIIYWYIPLTISIICQTYAMNMTGK